MLTFSTSFVSPVRQQKYDFCGALMRRSPSTHSRDATRSTSVIDRVLAYIDEINHREASSPIEVIELSTQRGRVVAYKVTRGGYWLGDYQSLDELGKVVDLADLDEL